MEAIELIELVSRGEDSRTQFKLNLTNPESLAGEIVAFSNSKGGKILVGISDHGEIVGLSPEDIRRINILVSNVTTNNVRPPVNTFNENVAVAGSQVVMVITVPEGISKPYADNNGVYWAKAGADKRRVTSREEIQRMFQEADLVHADEVPIEGTVFGDLAMAHLGEFFAKQYGEELDEALERDGISIGQLLNNLGLAHDNNLNLAGLILFGRNPQRYRPAFIVKAVSFVGNDPAGEKYRDSEDIGGCIRDMHRGVMSFLTRNLRRLQGEKDFNTEGDIEIPIEALEELVVNMLLHRDYFISAPWRVMIFDNRVELISPGMLPNNLTVENIRYGISNIRNPLLASFAIKELPYRGTGTGILRALKYVPDLELVSDSERNLFIARIPRKIVE
ncbi:MAG: putative DNA binding domain-containing protein [Syntrophales bacterium]|jgi:ATP-dependent DNA helicase RecG|nr:putative DNA binding domain-containing protein [Syntrophales bacterium]MCK9528167.1 putative DNA binding domain-containing protein [Syntrophales bacterium]MDX9921137.1 putative DNA binding domain-containing protein [Syntrophales bacterium]